MAMNLTINLLRSLAGSAAFDRGFSYFKQGRVTLTGYDEHLGIVDADVKGSLRKPYEVSLEGIGTKDPFGYCSCPMGGNCKHVVAVGLQWLAHNGGSDTSTVHRQRSPTKGTPLAQWLASIPKAPAETFGPIAGKHHLLYVMEEIRGQLKLYTKKGYLKKNGEWSQLKFYTPDYYELQWGTPNYIDAEDLTILHLLPRTRAGEYQLTGESGNLALMHLLKTGRFKLANTNTVITSGLPLTLNWQWHSSAAGSLQLQAQLDGLQHWHVLPVEPPAYIDVDKAQVGQIITELATEQMTHLINMPAVSEQELSNAALALRQVFNQAQLPLPEEPEFSVFDVPVPCIELVMFTVGHASFPACRFGYAYGDIFIATVFDDQPNTESQVQEQNGKYFLINRNIALETAYREQLQAFGLNLFRRLGDQENLWTFEPGPALKIFEQWQLLIDRDFPPLIEQGWRIDWISSYQAPIRPAEFAVSLTDKPNHWFEFGLRLHMDDIELDVTEAITYWMEAGTPDTLLLPIENDRWVKIDTQPLHAIHTLIIDLFQQNKLGKSVLLPGFQAAQLQPLTNLDDRQAPITRKLSQQLQNFNGLEAIIPSAQLQATLRPYQQQGLNWLCFLQRYGFGGILADDMGLGKTLQTIALIQHLKDNKQLTKPALIIGPTSLMGNWLHEVQRFAPTINTLLIHGMDRADKFKKMAKSDLIITSYPLLLRDIKRYEKHNFSLLVLDEAQAIKNSSTKISRAVRELNAATRLCLTGTPLENHLGELWSLMDFALPGLLGGQKSFQQIYRVPIENQANKVQQKQLAQRLAPFMLRRTKTDVVKELPPKTEIIQYVELEGNQRALYESIRASMEKRIRDLMAQKGMARSHIEFLDALLKLRQACIDPRLVKLEKAANIMESAKLEWLAENIPALIEEGRKILVFSQFTAVLGLIEDMLKKSKLNYCKLTGQTRKRQEAIDLFQQGNTNIFLISLKAGGSGLNLTAADVVIHVDPWWNPSVENQATDRAYRIGQDKPVFVYKLVATNTVEERIQQMQQQKQALANALFDETGATGMPQDKEALLALLKPHSTT